MEGFQRVTERVPKWDVEASELRRSSLPRAIVSCAFASPLRALAAGTKQALDDVADEKIRRRSRQIIVEHDYEEVPFPSVVRL